MPRVQEVPGIATINTHAAVNRHSFNDVPFKFEIHGDQLSLEPEPVDNSRCTRAFDKPIVLQSTATPQPARQRGGGATIFNVDLRRLA